MYRIDFEYKDALSKWAWRKQTCMCSSVKQCIEFYGLDKDDVEYKINKIEEMVTEK